VPPNRVPKLICFASGVVTPAAVIPAAAASDWPAFEGRNTPFASL
jgi:hypothetical protein